MPRPVFVIGATFADEKFTLDSDAKYRSFLRTLTPGRYLVSIEKETHSRSLKQNAYYHGVIVAAVSETTGYEPDEAHEVLKHFCNPKVVTVTNRETGVAEEVRIGGSTASLTVEDFAAFCSRCQRWAAETLSCYIPDPNELVA